MSAAETFRLFACARQLPPPATHVEVALLKELIVRADETGASHASISTHAKAIRVSESTAERAMRRLTSWGYVETVKRRGFGKTVKRRIIQTAIVAIDDAPITVTSDGNEGAPITVTGDGSITVTGDGESPQYYLPE